jgi:ABC-type multidrug transport system ATPase subunit
MRARARRCQADGHDDQSREGRIMPAVIDVQQLHKSYQDTVAVDDVSFTVQEGEIFGILGPNGAGKTTTVECIEGLRTPDRGQISVLGLDPQRDRAQLTQRLGAQLQESRLPDQLRVAEALELYSSFYQAPADWRQLMEVLGITAKARTPFGSSPAASSSGCRSRWPSSATHAWRCWTSSPPAWTHRPGGTPGS